MTKPDHHTLKHLARLESKIDYVFTDKKLAVIALTHSSYGDGRRSKVDNERLEFLGDRVLGLLTAELLYDVLKGDEGQMARKLNALVRKETCARIARRINLGDALMMSPSEVKQGGRDKTSILGDACEALLAALYLDGGYPAAQTFYNEFWAGEVDIATAVNTKDPKTVLQENAAAAKYGTPTYTVMERSGPDHRPLFVVEVSIEGLGQAQGTGKSKKDAERYAAMHLLESWSVS